MKKKLSPMVVASPLSVCAGMPVTLTAIGIGNNTLTPTHYTFTATSPTVNTILAGSSNTLVTNPYVQTSYVVVADSAGCTGSSLPNILTVNMITPLAINISQLSNTTCIISNSTSTNQPLTKPVTLNASGANTYVWSPYDPTLMTYSLGPSTSVRPLVTTQYTVVGYNIFCSGTTFITVTVTPQFTIAITPSVTNMCTGANIVLGPPNISPSAIGHSTAFAYNWTETNGNTTLSGYLSPTVIATPPATRSYSLEVSDTQSCVSLPVSVTVNVSPCTTTTSINQIDSNNPMSIYPNPVKNNLIVSSEKSTIATIEIHDILGKLILSKETLSDKSSQHTIDMSNILPGIYFLTIQTSDGNKQSVKVIKD